MLQAYLGEVKGTIFTEVSVGKHSTDAQTRRIDGVRVPSSASEIKPLRGGHSEFERRAKGAIVEAIEAKGSLNRSVIGQAIVGKHLLEIEYGVAAAVPVVVCKKGDQLLQQVCARLGVKVWTPGQRFVVP